MSLSAQLTPPSIQALVPTLSMLCEILATRFLCREAGIAVVRNPFSNATRCSTDNLFMPSGQANDRRCCIAN